ncbi:GNAT family N-acetyltransferase [Microvirga tunisiensis]|uniref:GNAT family N-acetyltransferase n=2 Tax=Pannonibacter tanglangensis TaxID=2750084 RepID=A0ABW9ZM86_9HYPH|nr:MULTISPECIES: GNAT family N-acetyltransferase [unclassified Pannonibacter]NBN65017.1 GNAT family N-acetyltransferase [Pannonibacter sp. XCT-34]NBN79526.1 GNAT family N-acetyltransferase [Pannonibacter sp. XCT-53]
MPHLHNNVVPTGRIRLLGSADKHLFRSHLLRLDPETKRSRFAMLVSDSFLEAYVETSFSLDTVIYGYFEDDVLRATAELRRVADDVSAEAAFCVEVDWRGQGLGSALMELVLIAARAQGYRHIYMNCLATNRSMQALARKFSADLSFEHGDVVAHLAPAPVAAADVAHAPGIAASGGSSGGLIGRLRELLARTGLPGTARPAGAAEHPGQAAANR